MSANHNNQFNKIDSKVLAIISSRKLTLQMLALFKCKYLRKNGSKYSRMGLRTFVRLNFVNKFRMSLNN